MKQIVFKEDVDPRDIFHLTTLARMLLLEVMEYCGGNGMQLVITSLRGDRGGVKTVSTTHADGRAFDIRTRDMMTDEAIKMVEYFNHNFKNIAAISYATNKPTCAKLKKDHIHFQVRRQ